MKLRRTLALILTALMVLGMIPGAMAAKDPTAGTRPEHTHHFDMEDGVEIWYEPTCTEPGKYEYFCIGDSYYAGYCPDDYSYSYHGEVGYLDRCFASPTMKTQVLRVQPWHINADWYYSHEAEKMRDKSLHRYSDHDPIIVDIRLH